MTTYIMGKRMNRLKILLLNFLLILVLSSCISDNETEIPQTIKLPTNTEAKTPPVFSTPTGTQEVNSNPMTGTPVPSKTKIPYTATETASPSFTNILDGKLIVLRDYSSNYLEDILTGRGSVLLAEGKAVDILRWIGNGCTFIVSTRDGIVEMDLQGKIIRNIFPFERLPDVVNGYILIDPPYYRRAIYILSPDESWVVYRIGSGSYEQRGDDIEPYRFEYENLETMPVDGTQGPYRLSQNGGAWRAAWSPDSYQIAYSDYDEHGVHQLFIINRDGGNRRQITSFTDPQVEIMKILWSPKGDKIALLVDQDGNGTNDKTIVFNIDENTSKLYEKILAEWWRDDDSFVAWKRIEKEPRHAEMITYDITTNNQFTIRPEGCHRINPFGNPSMMGCLTVDYEFIVYDTLSGKAIVYPNFDDHRYAIQYWLAAPDSYPGVIGCGYTP
jgi:hypothetical protein